MKKTLVALAALAVVGAASAQSTVTLYGKIDYTLRNQTQSLGGVKTALGNVGFSVDTAGLSGSRWGMKGSEDLGGGLKAIFQLENGFAIDTGGATATLTGTALFGRQAYAGLSGGFGTVTFGRQYTPLDTQWCTYEVAGCATPAALAYAWDSRATQVGAATLVGFHADRARQNNSILYQTPAMGGFTAQAMYAPGENKNPVTNQSAGTFFSFSVGYMNGPLGISFVHESDKVTAAAPAANVTTRNNTVQAQYDLGVAKLMGGIERSAQTGNNDETGWMLGAAIPVGAGSLAVSYARETVDLAALARDGKKTAFSIVAVYPLSKRTNLYADYRTGKTLNGATNLTTKDNMYGVGMRHDF